MRIHPWSLALVVGLSLSACSDGDSSSTGADAGVAADGSLVADASQTPDASTPADGSTPGLSRAEFVDEFPALYADAVLTCCPSEGKGPTRAQVIEMATGAVNSYLADDRAVWQRGIATFDEAEAAHIVEALRAAALDCESVEESLADPYIVAQRLIIGTLAENADCITPFEQDDFTVYAACAPGLDCVNHEPSKGDETYVCEPVRQIGQTCSTDDAFYACEPGAYCPDTTCVALKPDGAACEYDFECVGGGCNYDETTELSTCGQASLVELLCIVG